MAASNRRMASRLWALCAALALATGCDGSPAATQSTTRPAVVDVQGTRLTLQTDKPTYRAGTPITLTLLLTNPDTANPARVEFPSSLHAEFAITDASGRVVWESPGPVAHLPVVTDIVIPPAGSRTYAATATAPLPVGSYVARGTLRTATPEKIEADFSVR